MIIYVQFVRPVGILLGGSDYWDAAKHTSVTCTDKGTHLLFSFGVGTRKRRAKVPLMNIAYVLEEDEAEKGDKP